MYNETLTLAILKQLEKEFPRPIQIDELRQLMPEFSGEPESEWLTAGEALIKRNHARAEHVLFGQSGHAEVIANIEITDIGRALLHSERRDSGDQRDLDVLMPIFTKRQFEDDLKILVKATNASSPLSLLFVDIDDFKNVNTTSGHEAGDEVLIGIANALKTACDKKGRCYRWGGDELAILLPNFNLSEAEAIAERVRNEVVQLRFTKHSGQMTTSIGVATYPETSSAELLTSDADKAMYESKTGGKDRVSSAARFNSAVTQYNASRSDAIATEIVLSGNIARLKSYLESLREHLIESWDRFESIPALDKDWSNSRNHVYENEFIPALNATVEIGLRIIRNDVAPDWLERNVAFLVEAFEACRVMDQPKTVYAGSRAETVPFFRPAYDIYVGVRALATYALMRERFAHLRVLMPHCVWLVTPDAVTRRSAPLVLYPFYGVAGIPDMRDGRNNSYWNHRVQDAWGKHFRSGEKFLEAALQLEFILEFNSYFFMTLQQLKRLPDHLQEKYFDYVPDFWASRLDAVVPIAERFYEFLSRNQAVPPEFTIEKYAIDKTFDGKDSNGRLQILALFLIHLRTSQAEMMHGRGRYPFMFEWDRKLAEIVEDYKSRKKSQAASASV